MSIKLILERIEKSYHEFLDKYLGPDDSMLLPRETNFRWIPLFFCCFLSFGTYYGHDTPALLQTEIQRVFDITTTRFNLLFSFFYLPCIIMPFLGGLLTDKMGIRTGMFLFSILILLGQALVTYGMSNLSFELMIVGRFLHGLGHDCLLVGKKAIIAKWFLKGEIAFAMGLGLCISRLGSSLGSYTTPRIYMVTEDLSYPFLVGVYTCIFSTICVLILNSVDRYADMKELKRSLSHMKEDFEMSDLKRFPFIYYLLLMSCLSLYPVFFSFMNNASDMMVHRFGFDLRSAGSYISIVYSMSTLMTPLIGLFADKYGRKLYIILFASMIPFLTHFYIAFLEDTEEPNENMVIALVAFGLFYSCYASILWPCITAVVMEKVRATAYGIVISLENLLLTILPLIVGRIHDLSLEISSGYFFVEILYGTLSVLGIFIAVWLIKEDKNIGETLNARIGEVKQDNELLLTQAIKNIQMVKN